MIVAELQHTSPGETGYTTVATLTVNDDNTWTLDDPDDRFNTRLNVIDPQSPNPDKLLRNLAFEDNPARWVRRAHTIYKAGPQRVVLIADTGIPEDIPETP
jgi:hypothetical protein